MLAGPTDEWLVCDKGHSPQEGGRKRRLCMRRMGEERANLQSCGVKPSKGGVCCIVPETAGQAKGGLMFLSDHQWWAEGERSHLEERAEDVQARKAIITSLGPFQLLYVTSVSEQSSVLSSASLGLTDSPCQLSFIPSPQRQHVAIHATESDDSLSTLPGREHLGHKQTAMSHQLLLCCTSAEVQGDRDERGEHGNR
jgi:hypothetical protein